MPSAKLIHYEKIKTSDNTAQFGICRENNLRSHVCRP